MPWGGLCACDATVTLHAGGTARGAGRPLSGFGSGLAIFPRSVRMHRVNANICRRLAILPRLLGPTCMALGQYLPLSVTQLSTSLSLSRWRPPWGS